MAGDRLDARALMHYQTQVVVATPNRLLDLCGLLRSTTTTPHLELGSVKLCVMDEADEFLDRPEFMKQLAALARGLPMTSKMAFLSGTLARTTRDLIDAERLVRTGGPRCTCAAPLLRGPRRRHLRRPSVRRAARPWRTSASASAAAWPSSSRAPRPR